MPRPEAEFVRRHTIVAAASHVPEIRLHLSPGDSLDLWEQTSEAGQVDGSAPPFWAFAWAGGLALARHLLDVPAVVHGRRVVDVACGSGLVAVAAAVAGAREVLAVDVDPLAVVATRLNAELNDVRVAATSGSVEQLVHRVGPGDLVVAGDVFYDKDMAELMLGSLLDLAAAGAEVLVGDPMRAHLPLDRLEIVAEHDVVVDAELEDAAVKRSVVARLR